MYTHCMESFLFSPSLPLSSLSNNQELFLEVHNDHNFLRLLALLQLLQSKMVKLFCC